MKNPTTAVGAVAGVVGLTVIAAPVLVSAPFLSVTGFGTGVVKGMSLIPKQCQLSGSVSTAFTSV
jgi:hypothetical protein